MRILPTFLALALSTSVALAGEVGPLTPGTAAGVKNAQSNSSVILYGALGAAALGGFLVALTSGSNSGPAVAAPSTTSIASTV